MKYKKLQNIMVGSGRLFDFAHSYDSSLYDKYLNVDSKKLDRDGLYLDWVKVGSDLRIAMRKESENQAGEKL